MQEEMSAQAQQELLLEYIDQLRLSMAGNLQDYQMESYKVCADAQHARLVIIFKLGGPKLHLLTDYFVLWLLCGIC